MDAERRIYLRALRNWQSALSIALECNGFTPEQAAAPLSPDYFHTCLAEARAYEALSLREKHLHFLKAALERERNRNVLNADRIKLIERQIAELTKELEDEAA